MCSGPPGSKDGGAAAPDAAMFLIADQLVHANAMALGTRATEPPPGMRPGWAYPARECQLFIRNFKNILLKTYVIRRVLPTQSVASASGQAGFTSSRARSRI